MQRVLSYWIFGSVMLLAAGGQLYIPALAAWMAPGKRALGIFDISIGGVVLIFSLWLRAVAVKAAKRKRRQG